MGAKNGTSIRFKLLIFSTALFSLILTVGSAAFFMSMREIIRDNTHSEMTQMLEIERIKLESSVKGEISIALKMASSPLIVRHFLNPADQALTRGAFEEIASYRQAFGSKTAFWISDKDKRFYSDDAFVYTVDPNDPSNYWYKMTMVETDSYNFNINYNDQLNKIMLWINAVVKDGARKSVGIVGTGIDLSGFTDAIYRDYKGKAELYLFNELDEITGARDARLITDKRKLDAVFSDGICKEVIKTAKGLKAGETKIFSSDAGEIALVSVPTLNWYAVAVQPITADDYKTSMTTFFIMVLILIALIFIVFNIFVFGMVDPLKKMAKALHQTSTDHDLTRRLNVSRRDEIGTVAASVNEFIDTMRVIIGKLSVNSGTIAGASEELSRVSRQLADGSEKTVDRSDSVISTMDEMSSSINAMADGASKASAGVDSVAGAAEDMRENMSKVDGTIREMDTRISEIAKNTQNVRSIATEATGKAAGATEVMEKLSAAAKEIGRSTDVIMSIAQKTNLLALNATVEAARAGEAGKGFAVVAGEVKQLANQSAQNAKEITARIERIQADTKNAASVIGDVSGIIIKINKSVEDISENIDRQAKASSEITVSIANANTNAKCVADAIGDVSRSAVDVSRNASEAADGINSVSNSLADMHKAARDGAAGAEKVNQKADDLEKIAEGLKETVSKFRV